MPKRDKKHEEEQPKESLTKYEGGQGSKTREQQQKMRATKLHDFDEPVDNDEKGPVEVRKATRAGGARLDEDRQQHDEAEKNSEANRAGRGQHRVDETGDKRARGPGSSNRGSTGTPNGG